MSEAEYLGFTAVAAKTKYTKNAENVEKAISALHLLKNNEAYSGKFTAHTLLKIWQTYNLPRMPFGLHLVLIHGELKHASGVISKTMMATTTGCLSERMRATLSRLQ